MGLAYQRVGDKSPFVYGSKKKLIITVIINAQMKGKFVNKKKASSLVIR